MTKQEFVASAAALRKYWNWENEMSDRGLRFEDNPACELADVVLDLLTKGDEDWGYDHKIGMNWIVKWCSAPLDESGFRRLSQWITIRTADDLWDFVSEMTELGWKDQVENWRWL